jgi:aryl-alcohol dehydrogenase-like predicted oxidoreductase
MRGRAHGPLRTREQLDSALPAVDLDLGEEQLQRLDELFPCRKTAPEDYAR